MSYIEEEIELEYDPAETVDLDEFDDSTEADDVFDEGAEDDASD